MKSVQGILGYCLIIITLSSCVSQRANRSMDLAQDISGKIDSVCQAQLIEGHLPGLAIGLMNKDGRIWTKGYGFADRALRIAVKPNEHLFRIGSVSKCITSYTLALLKSNDLINIDMPISHYYKDCPADKRNITMRQLGSHLSGIRHYRGMEFYSNIHYDNPKDALEVFIHDTLLFVPGTDYEYSTYGYTLLSAVMEDAMNDEFTDIVWEQLIEGNDLKDLKPDLKDSIHFNRVQFYEWSTDSLYVAPPVDLSNKWAGGGYLCSAEDLTKFGFMIAASDYLNEETLREFTTPMILPNGKSTGYGIGFRVGEDKKGRKWFGHSGGSIGGTSMLLMYPDYDLVVVTLTNLTSARMDELAWEIADFIIKD